MAGDEVISAPVESSGGAEKNGESSFLRHAGGVTNGRGRVHRSTVTLSSVMFSYADDSGLRAAASVPGSCSCV